VRSCKPVACSEDGNVGGRSPASPHTGNKSNYSASYDYEVEALEVDRRLIEALSPSWAGVRSTRWGNSAPAARIDNQGCKDRGSGTGLEEGCPPSQPPVLSSADHARRCPPAPIQTYLHQRTEFWLEVILDQFSFVRGTSARTIASMRV
jgi:hypothetical protein